MLFAALILPLSALRMSAAEPVDLAADLGYLRVHSAVIEREAIAAALARPKALVLDLRYPQDERGADAVLRDALAGRTTGGRIYVLVSPATPVPVVGVVAANPPPVLTLGVKGARPAPQVVVLQTPEDDRRAYDAYTSGTSLADLTSGRILKARYDEASLVEEFKNGLSDPKPPVAASDETPPRLTDRVLQRALHLHRTLQALRRAG